MEDRTFEKILDLLEHFMHIEITINKIERKYKILEMKLDNLDDKIDKIRNLQMRSVPRNFNKYTDD